MRKKSVREGHSRLYEIAKERRAANDTVPAEAPAAPPPPPPSHPDIDTYLDPDTGNGRPRIIIMLTEDGAALEQLFYTKMSYIQAVSNLAIMANMHAQEILGYLFQLEQKYAGAEAEIEFLRQKLAENISPPRAAVQPAPKMPRPLPGEDTIG